MWHLGKQAFVGRRKYDSPNNDCVGGYIYGDQGSTSNVPY